MALVSSKCINKLDRYQHERQLLKKQIRRLTDKLEDEQQRRSLVDSVIREIPAPESQTSLVHNPSDPDDFIAKFPFTIPSSVDGGLLVQTLRTFLKLSRSVQESKRLAKSAVMGDDRIISKYTRLGSRSETVSGNIADYDWAYNKVCVKGDLAWKADGRTGQYLGMVSFAGDSIHYPDWDDILSLIGVGERHRSASVLAKTLALAGDAGLVVLAAESGELFTVKVFVGAGVYLLDGLEHKWTVLRNDEFIISL